MNCIACRRELQKGWKVCPWCGSAQKKPRHKRAHGLGTAYKRGRTWTACITIDTYAQDGKIVQRRRTKGGFATKTEALRYCATLTAQPVKKKAPSLAAYYELFLSGKMENLTESKRTAYKIAFNKLKDLHRVPISDISLTQLQSVMNEQCPTYYPARDVRGLLNHLYKLAAAEGNANPALPGLLELPKLQEDSREPFTADEQRLLWVSYEGGDTRAAIPLIMLYTGMMTGEMRKLHVDMIDLERGEIVGAGMKTDVRKKSSILLPDAIIPVLADAMERAVDGLLCPYSEMEFYAQYYGALEAAGIQRHLTPYSCRHTAATALAIDESIAPQTVQRLMRWSSTRMMDRYVHPSEADAKAAVNRRNRPD